MSRSLHLHESAGPRPAHGPLRIGIGGPVGSGKTALTERLCKLLRDAYDIATCRPGPCSASRMEICLQRPASES